MTPLYCGVVLQTEHYHICVIDRKMGSCYILNILGSTLSLGREDGVQLQSGFIYFCINPIIRVVLQLKIKIFVVNLGLITI